MTATWCTAPGKLTLPDAITAAALADGAVGFLSSATDHLPVRQQDGRLWTPDGPAELTGVYSARLFDEHADLRWLHTARSLGTAVVVTEDPTRYPTWTTEPLPTVSTLDGSYAVWGRRFEATPGNPAWTRAKEGRLGWLDLPLDATRIGTTTAPWPARYIQLDYREYLTEDRFGNLSVADERLIRLRPATPTTGETP